MRVTLNLIPLARRGRSTSGWRI